MSILGIYRKEAFNKTLRVGTPDPSKYHDARQVRLEGANESPIGAKMPANEKFGLPGVVIPHAKREGGSMGWDSEAPMKVFVDPEQTGGRIQIDIGDIRRNPKAMVEAIKDSFSRNVEYEDAIVEAFARFAKPLEGKSSKSPPVHIPEPELPREAPLQMPGSYVVPKAAPGGGQIKKATFTKKPEIQDNTPPLTKMQLAEDVAAFEAVNAVTRQARSLHEELAGGATVPSYANHPVRKVTFELPLPGGRQNNLGQFVAYYSDVVVDGANLVLVCDNSNPSQITWLPPALEDPESGEPLAIAVLVHGLRGEQDVLYKAFPTGVKFKYRNEEFCLLTIETSKQYNEGAR